MNRTRRQVLATAGLTGLIGCTAWNSSDDLGTVHVPDSQPTIQDGVDAANEGDLVLVEPGIYEESVAVSTPGITIRGRDRNEVVLDGKTEQQHGVQVTADEVAVENMTGHHYTNTAFHWSGVEGFRGSYLTAYNNGLYGIYAYGATDGRFEHSYASGHPDAGFYFGRNQPFDAVISNVTAEHNNMGYSGTSTGDNLTIRDSTWRYNRSGIVPNTIDENSTPQHSSHIVGNEVYENHNADAPSMHLTFGSGIVVWGGKENLIEENEVRDHEYFGIVVENNLVDPSGNVVRENEVTGSGTADLALGDSVDSDNEFRDNEFSTSLPEEIESDSSAGTEQVTEVFEKWGRRLEDDDGFSGDDWRDAPIPNEQPTLVDPEAPVRAANRSASWDE